MWDITVVTNVCLKSVQGMQNQEFLFSRFAESLLRATDCIFDLMNNGPIGQFGIGDGEHESVFQKWLGEIADAFIKSTQKGGESKIVDTARHAGRAGQGMGGDDWQRLNAAMMGTQPQMA